MERNKFILIISFYRLVIYLT